MKTLIETADRSLVESLRVALEGQGIDVQVQDLGAASLPFIPIHVRVRDEDFALAKSTLQTLKRSSLAWETPRALRRTLQVLLAILALSIIVSLCL